VALLVFVALAGLAGLAAQAMRQRNALALEGRVLGLAHYAERELRESGVIAAEEILSSLLEDAGPAVRGLVLLYADGQEVVAIGNRDVSFDRRSIDLYLGRSAGGGPRGTEWTPGRGRFTLQLFMDPVADALPLATRLILPVAVVVGCGLVALAALGGHLLVRHRRQDRDEAQRRRLDVLGRAGAGLAHQVRTPLATIKGSCQLVAECVTDERCERRLKAAIAEAERMERMLGLLLDYARPPSPESQTVQVADLASEIPIHNDAVRWAIPETAQVFADPIHLVEILTNLIGNALAFSPPGKAVDVTSNVRGGTVEITVADRGPGPGASPEELFEPYTTTRVDGTGLGLPIARNLAEVNGGSLVLRQRSAGGCEAILTLPEPGWKR
jgi:signal transduction histidine kinase